MKILAISDTHGSHHLLENTYPEYFERDDIDLIIHAGDISSYGSEHQIIDFLEWYSKFNQIKNKVFIAGNHDFFF